MMSVAVVIPARMNSTRFPNKPLALIKGMTMIERVWRIAKSVRNADKVIIATDDPGLKKIAENFGAEVILTSSNCLSGTDRVAEVSYIEDRFEIFFNLQGDAVLTPPWVIEQVIEEIKNQPSISMATASVCLKKEALKDFVQKKAEGYTTGTTVVFDKRFNALYFSKSLLPYHRDDSISDIYCHIGVYAYRKKVLQKLTQLPEGFLEKKEKLEQLRALENGISIRVIPVDYKGRSNGSVDRLEDVAFVEKIIEKEGELL